MNSNFVGILIIIAIIVIGVATGGDIFRGGNGMNATSTSRNAGQGDVRGDSGSTSNGNSATGDSTTGGYFGNQARNPNASIYEGKISINNINNGGTFNEYAVLSTDLDDNESVVITGWKLKSTVTGREIVIGGAANIPIVGVRDQSPITLPTNAEVIVSTGFSPIGTSFRINKCAGFLEERKNFSPSIWTRCPATIDDVPPLSRTINDICLDYIENLPRCEIPGERDFPDNLTNACETFLKTKVDYENCVVNHVGDPDFLEPEWRVYTGLGGIWGREKRENIQLLDNSGKVVDTYGY
mgnify:FL=1